MAREAALFGLAARTNRRVKYEMLAPLRRSEARWQQATLSYDTAARSTVPPTYTYIPTTRISVFVRCLGQLTTNSGQ